MLTKIKHISVKQTKGWSVWRPYFHAVHYPKSSPSLESQTDLPAKYSADKWKSGFTMPDETDENCVISCKKCQHLKTHKLNWPQDLFFKVEYKGRTLWARDREMASKILEYIESKSRLKRIASDSNYVVQDRDLRKIPTHFQTAKARQEISKKLRKILGLPNKLLN